MRAPTHTAGSIFSIALLITGAALISACGSGGGDDTPVPPPPSPPVTTAPATPVANLTVSMKQLNFAWAAVPTATSYKLLRNSDGVSGFTQVGADISGSTFGTALEIAVHLTDWLNARYQIQACNAIGCTTSNDLSALSGAVPATGYFKASNTGPADFFGNKVIISRDGSTLAVAAYNEASNAANVGGDQTNNSLPGAGAVYVFARNSAGQWAKQAYIKASSPGEIDGFGGSIALSSNGNTLAVGAVREDSTAKNIDGNDANDGAGNSGAAYVYVRNGQTWSKQAYVKAFNTQAADFFGASVALSGDGNRLAVGAIGEDGAGVINGDIESNQYPNSGAVFLYRRTGSTWAPEAYLKSTSGNYLGDEMGSAMAMSEDGNTLAVAALRESVNKPAQGVIEDSPLSGAVYVFVNTGSTWIEQRYIKASNSHPNLFFGNDIALSSDGNVLAVTATADSSEATGVGGSQTGIAAPNSGAVYVYARFGGVWGPANYIKPLNTGAQDLFGSGVALNSAGTMLVVGAPGESSHSTGIDGNQANDTFTSSGAAYVFTRAANGPWSQRAYVKAKVSEADDKFGSSVSLSGDGQTLAVSSLDGSNAVDVGGDPTNNLAFRSGAVMLY